VITRIGLDRIEAKWPLKLKRARAGLLVHTASINIKLQHAVDCILKSKKIKVCALFGPQHGIRGETQDNMIEWEGYKDEQTGLPVYSLYSSTRIPEHSMLTDLDVLIVDMQDVGSRYYTYIWTVELCMRVCSETGTSLIVLDRPNPISGSITEGPVVEKDFTSFVGLRPLPVRHGMTIGEIGSYVAHTFYPNLDYHVVPMEGWNRCMWFGETGLQWVMPSPNMPTIETATVYPGMCLLEGTELSEGRGTTRPFEIFGAPFIEPEHLVKRINRLKLEGVTFRPLFFQPTFQKHTGKLCGGAQIHITDRERFKPFKTGVAVIKTVHDLYPEHFRWKNPPYEYETEKMPIDILSGSDRIRNDIERGEPLKQMEAWWHDQCSYFNRNERKQYLLYA
jgi:uncharacterized protein YbbC (DUF1343 family)